jgi:hypothetical protein
MQKFVFLLGGGNKMSKNKRKEALKNEIELMEREILYLTGRKRARARYKYLKLLRSCGKECGLEKPIYLKRAC